MACELARTVEDCIGCSEAIWRPPNGCQLGPVKFEYQFITYWFPYRERGKATGVFQSAVAVASIVGNPVGGYLLGMHGLLGLDGWQWMFILEGVPTAVFALAVPWLLTDRPEQARWLTAEQRQELATAIRSDEPPADRQPKRGVSAVLRDSRVLRLIYVYFAIQLGVYGVTFWLPALVKRIGGLTDVQVGLLAALPWVFALAGVLVLPWLSDRTGNRRGPLLIALACTLLGLLGGAALPPWPGLFALCVAAFGFLGAQPVFWTVPPTILAGVQVAATIPLISGIGNLGGFVGPSIMGFTEEATGSGAGGLYLIAAVVLLGGIFAATFRWVGRRT